MKIVEKFSVLSLFCLLLSALVLFSGCVREPVQTEAPLIETGFSLRFGHPMAEIGDTVYFLEPGTDSVLLTAWKAGEYRTCLEVENADPNNTAFLYTFGETLLFLGANNHIFSLDPSTGEESLIGGGQLYTSGFAVYGNRLYYLDGILSGHLAVLDMETGETIHTGADIVPRNNDLCFDGTHIYYVSAEDNSLWRCGPDGSNPEKWPGEILLYGLTIANNCLYAGDGTKLYRLPDGFWENPETAVILTEGTALLTGDGNSLIYTTTNGLYSELYVLSAGGESTALGTAPAWSAATTSQGVFIRPGESGARWQPAGV